MDARQEMDLALVTGGSSPSKTNGMTMADSHAESPYMGEFWNWCMIAGCRPIIKAGRLFEKRGFHKQFK